MKDLSCVPEEYQRREWRWETLVEYRPWWGGSYLFARRQDAQTNSALPPNEEYGPGVIYTPPKVRGGEAADRDALCAAYDEANPLPFPGFRVGQIWGVEYGGEFIVSDPLTKAMMRAAYGTTIICREGSGYVRDMLPTDVPQYAQLFGLAGAGFSLVRAHKDFNALNVFLLVDPLCPSAAPWSGVIPPNALDKVPR